MPSPKLQFHEVGTYPTLASDNWTAKGAKPDDIFVVKRETGGSVSTVILIIRDVLALPPAFVTVRETPHRSLGML